MTQTVSTGTWVTPADLAAFCIEAMRLSGLNEEDARVTADVLVTTDTWEVSPTAPSLTCARCCGTCARAA